MNRNDIQSEIEIYNENRYVIESIFFDDVMEALNESIDDNENKRNFGQKLKMKIETMIKEFFAAIDRWFLKATNTIKSFLQTNDGFRRSVRTRMRDVKPLEAVKLIAYQYNDTSLDQLKNKLYATIDNLFNSLSSGKGLSESDKSPLDLSTDELNAYVLKTAGFPSEVTSLNLSFEHMKKTYRVGKKEQLFTASKIPQYLKITEETPVIQAMLNKENQKIREKGNKLKNHLLSTVMKTETQNEIKRKTLDQSKNVVHLMNFYTSFLNIYMQLRIEKIFSFRMALKKLLQF